MSNDDDTQDLAESISPDQLTLGSWDAARKQNEELMDRFIPDLPDLPDLPDKTNKPCECSLDDLMARGCTCGGD